MKNFKNKSNDIETYSRKNNIIINGIPEVSGETNEICESAVWAFLRNTLNIDGAVVDDIQCTRCHRLMAQIRHIIVRFRDYSDREYVWKNMRVMPKNSNFSLNEDFPKFIVYYRNKLLPVFNKAMMLMEKGTFHFPRIDLLFLLNIINLNH